LHAALAGTSLSHAYATVAAIQRAVNHLEPHPHLGKQIADRPGERLLVVPRTHYSIAYRLIARGMSPRVEIMRLVDQRRQLN
jgi:plasmid stabilization system protein ParE